MLHEHPVNEDITAANFAEEDEIDRVVKEGNQTPVGVGQVVRNGRGIRQVILYREAVDPRADAPEDVDVAGVAEGLMLDWKCTACGKTRKWVPGEEALRRLMEQQGVLDAYEKLRQK